MVQTSKIYSNDTALRNHTIAKGGRREGTLSIIHIPMTPTSHNTDASSVCSKESIR
jgi:hypothetical protein